MDYLGMLQMIKEPIGLSIVPFRSSVYQTKVLVEDFTYVLASYRNLSLIIEEKEKLKTENTQLQLEVQSITDENIKLRTQLGAPLPSSFQFIPARVLSITRFMEIDSGQKDGVKVGMPVVYETTFLGKIISVDTYRSRVMLPSDVDMQVSAITSRGTRGNIVGQFGQGILMDKILQKDPLFLEDNVLTGGMDDMPAYLLIGKIKHINSDDASAYKKGKVESILNYKSIKSVFIISSR